MATKNKLFSSVIDFIGGDPEKPSRFSDVPAIYLFVITTALASADIFLLIYFIENASGRTAGVKEYIITVALVGSIFMLGLFGSRERHKNRPKRAIVYLALSLTIIFTVFFARLIGAFIQRNLNQQLAELEGSGNFSVDVIGTGNFTAEITMNLFATLMLVATVWIAFNTENIFSGVPAHLRASEKMVHSLKDEIIYIQSLKEKAQDIKEFHESDVSSNLEMQLKDQLAAIDAWSRSMKDEWRLKLAESVREPGATSLIFTKNISGEYSNDSKDHNE